MPMKPSLTRILDRYGHIIVSHSVDFSFDDEESESFAFTGNFYFKQGIRLVVREYCFPDGRHKYSFHVQDSENNLVFRYDNEPHWVNLPNFPHHKHLPDSVEPSTEMNLEMVFVELARLLS
jgi:hypothetical protein